MFCETAVRHTVYQIRKFTNLLKMKSSANIFLGLWSKRSFLQLCRTTTFLVQLWMATSDHLFNKCDQKIRQVKNQIITHQIPAETLKQLGLWNCSLVFSKGWGMLYLNKRCTWINVVQNGVWDLWEQAFFQNLIQRYLYWLERFADYWKNFGEVILNWKMYQKLIQ